jgi:hypothetical protein
MTHLKGEEEPFAECAIFYGGNFLLKVKVTWKYVRKTIPIL